MLIFEEVKDENKEKRLKQLFVYNYVMAKRDYYEVLGINKSASRSNKISIQKTCC